MVGELLSTAPFSLAKGITFDLRPTVNRLIYLRGRMAHIANEILLFVQGFVAQGVTIVLHAPLAERLDSLDDTHCAPFNEVQV